MRFLLRLMGLLWLSGPLAAPAAEPPPLPVVEVYFREWLPYNYSEAGEIKGLSIDILRASCREAGLSCRFNSVPWARALATVQRRPNSLLTTAVRGASREGDYRWIGPAMTRSTWLWVRADSEAPIRERKGLAGLRFGVVRGEWSIQDLHALGVPSSAMLNDASSAAVLRLLLGGWVDALVNTELSMAWQLQRARQSPDTVVKLRPVSGDSNYYFALNRDSDPRLAERLQEALDKLRKSGALEPLQRSYELH